MELSDCLFLGVYPTAIAYTDHEREEYGDYRRLAFLPLFTLELDVEQDCPAD